MNLHIHCPPHHFIGQVRGFGCRKWRTVTRNHASAESALSCAIDHMRQNDKRARVLLIDESGYYDPNLVMEAWRA